jgi:hypothetical protein
MDGSCGSFVFTRMDGNDALGEIFIHQLAEQFWSGNLVTAAFGVRIPNISN